jgi:D-3-phosphoglycerate dehydrogenase / 2-oxoglutarate reductase
MISVPVTPRSFRQVPGEHQELLLANGMVPRYPTVDRLLREAEMIELVAGCRVLLVGLDPVTDAVLAAGPLALVVKYGSGLDNVDLEAAERRGVRVVPTPGTNSPSVAELTIALLFALARDVVPHHRAMVDGSRARKLGIELAGRQLGILGFGNIGRRVAALAHCIGMQVVVHDPFATASDFEVVGFERLLRSDAVSIHVPYSDATHHLIDRRALEAMRPEAILVNTSRPAIVDLAALADALEGGRISGAAFDDLSGEQDAIARLLASDRFVATPHCGAATIDAVVRTGTAAVRALLEHRSLWQA